MNEKKQIYPIIFILSILFLGLLYITTKASFVVNPITASVELWPNDWFKATILDFYNNQFVIYCWMIYKEKSVVTLIILFALCIFFGSFTSIAYLMYQLYKHKSLKNAFSLSKRDS